MWSKTDGKQVKHVITFLHIPFVCFLTLNFFKDLGFHIVNYCFCCGEKGKVTLFPQISMNSFVMKLTGGFHVAFH